MKALQLHRWDVTPAEARQIQLDLRHRLERSDRIPHVKHVAGADIAFELRERGSWRTGEARAIAGVIVYRFPDERSRARQRDRAFALSLCSRIAELPRNSGALGRIPVAASLTRFDFLRWTRIRASAAVRIGLSFGPAAGCARHRRRQIASYRQMQRPGAESRQYSSFSRHRNRRTNRRRRSHRHRSKTSVRFAGPSHFARARHRIYLGGDRRIPHSQAHSRRGSLR